MPKPRTKNARVTSTSAQGVPLGGFADLQTYDGSPRRVYVLRGNTDRVLIGTTANFSDVLEKVFRANGMVETDYFVSEPTTLASGILLELRAFSAENAEEQLDLNLFRGIKFSQLAEKAASMIPGMSSP